MKRHALTLSTAISLCLVCGCDEQKSPAPAATASAAQPAAPATVASGRRVPKPFRFDKSALARRRQGQQDPAQRVLRAALQTPNLTSEQRSKLEALREPVEAQPGDGVAHDAFRTAVAEAAKAGKVDPAAFATHFEAMSKKHDERLAARAKMLNDLHAALSPEQRKATADKIRERLNAAPSNDKADGHAKGAEPSTDGSAEAKAAPPAEPKGHEGPGHDRSKGPGHDLSPRLNKGKGPGRMPGMHGARRPGGPSMHGRGRTAFGFAALTRGLSLTEEQQKKVDEVVKSAEKAGPSAQERTAMRDEAKKNMLALLDAFEKDTFDATKLAVAKARGRGDWMKAQLDVLSSLLAILTEEQRGKLAERLNAKYTSLPEDPGDTLRDLPEDLEEPAR